MPVVMEMILLLLFFGGYSASLEASTPVNSPFTLVTKSSEAPNLHSVTSNYASRVPEKSDSTGYQTIPPSSAPYTANEVSFPETSVAASSGLSIAGPTISQEVSTEKPSAFQEISNVSSNTTPPAMNILRFHNTTAGTMATSTLETSNGTSGPPITMVTSSQESSNGTSGLPITMATSSQESSNGTSGLPITMATNSQESSNGTSGLPITMATSSQERANGTSGLPVTMATNSLDTSDRTSGPPVTIATSYLETSSGTSVLPGTMATSSLETPKETSGSPTSWETMPILTTPKASTNTDSGPSVSPGQRTNNTLIMAVLVALLVVIVLLALLLLWRQRQKRRTGALTLSRGGKRNGAVDAWAGPARVSDEEAVITTAGGSGGDKGSGIPEGEGSGRRPTLTTFFGRRKSRQGSLALEELKGGSTSNLKGEEEPLVGSENGAVEAADSDGQEVGDVEVP